MTRAVWIAGGLSLCVHALALLAFRGQTTTPPAAAPATAPVELEVLRLSGLVPSAHAAAASAPSKKPPLAARAAPSGSALTARVAAAVEPEPSPAEGSPAPGAALPSEPAVEAGPPAAASSAANGTGLPAGPSSSGADDDPLDTAALSRRLQEGALHCYPAAASRFRQSGVAQVTFCLDGAGALREATVASSSGSALLDRAATDCVVPAAAPFEPRTFGRCFTVPVRFRQ